VCDVVRTARALLSCSAVAPQRIGEDRSDESLVAALNGGDTSAFDAIYYRYRDWVVRLAYRFTLNHADALDVLQETFTYLFRKFPGFILSARMTTFLYPVVKNLSIAARGKRDRHTNTDKHSDPVAPAVPDHAETTRSELSSALGALSDAQREVLLMRFVDDMSLAEIARALGIPEGTVKSRIHSAIATLKQDQRAKDYFQR
jgi:RNA polymerase sigma-70 factor (ECF subfamily)